MRRNTWILGGSLLLCCIGIGAIVLLPLLGKDGQFDGGRLAQGTFAASLPAFALLSSPLLGVAALCAWWRQNRRLAAAGLLAAALSVGVTLWGNLADYLSWSWRPPPTDQVTYQAGFFAMLASWVVCVAYGVVGLVAR